MTKLLSRHDLLSLDQSDCQNENSKFTTKVDFLVFHDK